MAVGGGTVPSVNVIQGSLGQLRAQATEFDTYLAGLIEARGYPNLTELAREAGVSEASLSRWWNGVRGLSDETLRRLAPTLGVRCGDLLVMAGRYTAEELGIRGPAPKPRRIAKVLTDSQDFIDDPRTKPAMQQRLLRRFRFELNMAFEERDGIPKEGI